MSGLRKGVMKVRPGVVGLDSMKQEGRSMELRYADDRRAFAQQREVDDR
jgi:hypothetical protein